MKNLEVKDLIKKVGNLIVSIDPSLKTYVEDAHNLASAIQAAVKIKQESSGDVKSFQRGEIRESSVVVLVESICKVVSKFDSRFQNEKDNVISTIKAIDLIAADGKFDRHDISLTITSIG